MEIIRINPDNINEAAAMAVSIIKRGGSIVYPTDTVYGLGVDALREYSIERLFKIKRRPTTKPVPIIIRDIEMAKKLAFVNRRIERVLEQVWPGPVTVVLEKRAVVSNVLTAGKNTVGLRIPDAEFTSLLMENSGNPITATSANFSGQPPLTRSLEVIKTFEKIYPGPDLFLDIGDLTDIPPSTVLDLTGEKPKILRIGPVNKSQLMEMFKK